MRQKAPAHLAFTLPVRAGSLPLASAPPKSWGAGRLLFQGPLAPRGDGFLSSDCPSCEAFELALDSRRIQIAFLKKPVRGTRSEMGLSMRSAPPALRVSRGRRHSRPQGPLTLVSPAFPPRPPQPLSLPVWNCELWAPLRGGSPAWPPPPCALNLRSAQAPRIQTGLERVSQSCTCDKVCCTEKLLADDLPVPPQTPRDSPSCRPPLPGSWE